MSPILPNLHDTIHIFVYYFYAKIKWDINKCLFRAEAFTSLQQYHLQIIAIISPAMDSSKQTVNRDILVMACQSFSVSDCV